MYLQAGETVVIDAQPAPPGAGVQPGVAPIPIVVPVTPNTAPVAAFTVSCVGLACAVDGSASTDPDGSVVSHQWTFGDGSGASGAKPAAHTFAAAGSYTITLTVFDERSGNAASSQTVTVLPAPTVKTRAVSRSGKLRVDVDPNLKKKGYLARPGPEAEQGRQLDHPEEVLQDPGQEGDPDDQPQEGRVTGS